MEEWFKIVNEQPTEYVAVAIFVTVAVGVAVQDTYRWLKKVRGNYMRKKRARLSREVREIIEDNFVETLSTLLEPHEVIGMGGKKVIIPPKITIEQARVEYAKMAAQGFWGLHPTKFDKRKTPEDLHELKVRLQEQRAIRQSSKKPPAYNAAELLDDLEAELNG